MTTYTTEAFPKTCGCGAAYAEEAWRALNFDGIQEGSDDTGRRFAADLEMRRCLCGSTICVPISEL